MLFNYWKKQEQTNALVKALWVIIALMFFLVFMLGLFLADAPHRIRVYIPPDLANGALLKSETPNKSNVYAFAFQIFTAINSWPESGTKSYLKNINAYRNYLSPRFFNHLTQDESDRAANGELARTRIMSGVSSMGYTPKDVKNLGNGSWLVNLHLQIVETLDGSVIKNVIMDYPLVLEHVHESIQLNPWGFVIAGYPSGEEPYRIKTII